MISFKKIKPASVVTKKGLLIFLSAVVPFFIFFLRPLNMNISQSAVISLLVLVIIWWSTGIVNKTIASLILLMGFMAFSNAPLRTIFSFPLSDTFLLIAITYLFSRGVTNSGLAERYLEPLLSRYANTPFKSIMFAILILVITIYAIPQPLARLIIVADIFNGYLQKTDVDKKLHSIMMFSVFTIYIFVNMCTLRADIILNSTSVAVAGLNFSDWDWIKYMAVPSVVYLAGFILLFMLVFRREVVGKKISIKLENNPAQLKSKSRPKSDISMILLLGLTIFLWFTESVHGIPAWIVTLCSIAVMLILGVLHLPGLVKAIDVPMLIFLTAAMSIGGVMSDNGSANIVFSEIQSFIPMHSVYLAIGVIMLITICMHMFLGSNTTTLSVVIPGVVYMCKDILPIPIIMFVIYITLATQWLFPFQSVGLMMGASKRYFPAKYIFMIGIPLTLVVFLAIYTLYIPWWKFLGLIA